MKKTIRFIKRYFYAVASCFYLFSIGFVSSKNRGLISGICRHFGYTASVKLLIHEVETSEVLSPSLPVHLHELSYTDGNVSLLELVVITSFIQKYQPEKLFEIGTFDGRTTLNMAANSSPEARIYTLDLPRDNLDSTGLDLDRGDIAYIDKKTSGARYIGTGFEKKITQLYGDSAQFDFSSFCGSIDFVFIDGSHAYDYVLSDTDKAFRLLKPKNRGVILWHDYGEWEGVTRALNELYLTDKRFRDLRHIKDTTLVYLVRE